MAKHIQFVIQKGLCKPGHSDYYDDITAARLVKEGYAVYTVRDKSKSESKKSKGVK